MLYEQSVSIEEQRDGKQVGHRLRRIELHLDEPGEEGARVMRLLTNVPDSLEARPLAQLYRRRWPLYPMVQSAESCFGIDRVKAVESKP